LFCRTLDVIKVFCIKLFAMSAKKNTDTLVDSKADAPKTELNKTELQDSNIDVTPGPLAEGEIPATNGSGKIHIVVADDHAVLRESLSALLGTQPDIEVVGAAADGSQALDLVQAKHPDVLVLDLFMPGSDGFEVLRTLDKAGSRVATVVLTGSESETDYTNVVRLGGRGLVLKSDGPEKLFAAVRAVAQGELAFSDDMAQRVLSTMAADTRSFMQAQASSLDRLSERERQIAFCVARGKKNKDISAQLNISENTVKRHLQSIFNKTGARDRLELAVLALNEASKQAA
jgi:DNA-binding NarL/FixJ family response regulator